MASVENTDILSGLINDFFGVVAEDIKIVNPYSIEICKKFAEGDGDINELRHTLRDIAAFFRTADFVSELQLKKTKHFHERMLYYPFKRFCENYGAVGLMEVDSQGRPNRYSSLRPVYALNILDNNYYNDDISLRIFEMFDPIRNLRFGKELVKVGVFEFRKANIETANQEHWRDYFTSSEIKSDAPDYIKKASEVIDFTNLGEEERKVAEALEKAQATIQDELAYSFYEGRAEGVAEGEARLLNERRETAKSMFGMGLTSEQIAKALRTSIDEVNRLCPN